MSFAKEIVTEVSQLIQDGGGGGVTIFSKDVVLFREYKHHRTIAIMRGRKFYAVVSGWDEETEDTIGMQTYCDSKEKVVALLKMTSFLF